MVSMRFISKKTVCGEREGSQNTKASGDKRQRGLKMQSEKMILKLSNSSLFEVLWISFQGEHC